MRNRKNRWNPERTWVFAVGVLRYPDGEHWPQEGRRDAVFIETLVGRGVPRSQVRFLRDADATLGRVRAGLASTLPAAREGDTLLFYYAGHGGKSDEGVGQFVLYDEPMPMPSLFALVERHFPGRAAMLFADCCHSGALALDAIHRSGRVACGVVASSFASRASTGAWTFTDCLVDAFGGCLATDADGDGLVGFRELAHHAERELAFCDGQLSTFVTTHGFDADLVLAPGVPKAHPRLYEHVTATASDGERYRARIVDARDGEFRVRFLGYDEADDEWVAEADAEPWTPEELAPGTRVEAQDEGGDWYPAEVLAARSGVHLVHYDGYEDFWDEWVDRSRLREPR